MINTNDYRQFTEALASSLMPILFQHDPMIDLSNELNQ